MQKNANERKHKKLIQIKYLSSYSKIVRIRLKIPPSLKKVDSNYEIDFNILVFDCTC